MQWNPIETAPKDRRILLYCDGFVVCGAWDDDSYSERPRPHWISDRPHPGDPTTPHPPTMWAEIQMPENAPAIPAALQPIRRPRQERSGTDGKKITGCNDQRRQ